MTPSGWRLTSLEDIGRPGRPAIKAGPFGSSLKKEYYVNIGYRVYGQEQVIAGDLAVGDYYIDEDRYQSLRGCSVEPGDVLVSLVGTVGRSLVVPDGAEPGIINPRLIRISPGTSVADAYFIRYWLESPDTQSRLGKLAQGGTMGVLNASSLKAIPLLLPPLPEQKKIAAILGSVDDAIQATQAVIDQTRKVKAGLLQQLLTRGIGQTRFKQTELGEMPENWLICRIDQVGAVQAGRQRSPHFTAGAMRPYLRVANVLDDRIELGDVLEMPFTDTEFERYKLEPGDILLNEGQSLELVGRCAMFEQGSDQYAFQNTLVRFRPSSDVLPHFALAVFQWQYRSGIYSEIATQTTSIAHLGVSRFAALKIPVPPVAEQAQICEVINSVSAHVRAQEDKLKALANLRRGLMSDLLTGHKRVEASA